MIHIEKIVKIQDLELILLVSLLPFLYQADYYFSQIFITFFILLICCLPKLLGLKKVSVSRTDMIILLFLSVYLLNVWLIRQWNIDDLQYYEWGALIAVYFLARTFDRRNIDVLFCAIITSGVLQSAIGLFQYTGLMESSHTYFKVTGYFSNPALLGCYLATSLTAAFYLYTKRKNLYDRLFLSAIIAFIIFVLVLSDSRAAWLACIAGVLFIAYKTPAVFSGIRVRQKNKIIYILSGVIIVSMVTGGLYYYKKDSANARLLIWAVSKDIICDAPLTGHGINSFPAIYMDYQGEYFKRNPESRFRSIADNNTQAFNEYLKITCETGVVGLIIIIALLFTVFSGRKILAESFGLVVLSVFSLFSYPADFFTTCFLFPLFIGISNNPAVYTFNLKNKAIVIAAVCLIVSCIMVRGLSAFRTYNAAFSQLEIESPDIILENNIKYMASYSRILFDQGRYEEFIRYTNDKKFPFMTSVVKCDIGIVYWKTGDLKNAEDVFEEAGHMVPSKILPKYLLFSLYKESGNSIEACRMAEIILQSDIRISGSIAIKAKREARSYINGSGSLMKNKD